MSEFGIRIFEEKGEVLCCITGRPNKVIYGQIYVLPKLFEAAEIVAGARKLSAS